jgi:cysteine desulfurase
MPERPVYLDYAATTPVDPRVVDLMVPWLYQHFGNPASNTHVYGWDAEKAVELARAQVAELIGSEPREVVWTSGATESNNLALKGAAQANTQRGRHIVTVKTEHKAVLDTCKELENQGFDVTYLDVQPDGLVSLDDFERSLRPDTVIASVMHVNNEIGVVQNNAALGALCRERGVLFHVDAAQSAGKLPIDVNAMNVDLMSLCAHKIYGPKGIGALYVRRKPKVRLQTQIHGGGHERGFRSGTLATHQIVGMGSAFQLAQHEMHSDNQRILQLRQRLADGLLRLPGVYVNGSLEHRVAGNLNLSFDYIEGEALIMSLSDIAVSSGSACTSASLEPSYVLRALGRPDQLAHSSIRFSLGRFTTPEQVDLAVSHVVQQVQRLRELSPLWEEAAGTSPVAGA